MNLHPQDIIIRKTDGTETLWLSQRLVMEVCGISEGQLAVLRNRYKKKGTRECDLAKAGDFMPKGTKSWRWAKTSQGFYYCLDNIPDRAPKYYRSMFGTAEELREAVSRMQEAGSRKRNEVVKMEIKQAVKGLVNSQDIRYYMYEASHLFAQAQAQELAAAKAWCEYMLYQLEEDRYKQAGIRRKQDFFTLCAEILAPLNLKGLNVSSGAYLRNKLDKFPVNASLNEQREWLISDNYGNEYRKIIGKMQVYDEATGEVYELDPHEALILSGYMNIGCSEKQYMSRIYEEYYLPSIAEFGMEPVAPRTFTNYLQRFDKKILTQKARHGSDYYKKHFLPYVKGQKLQYAHSLFSADGSGTITYQYWGKDEKGKRILRTQRLYVMMVIDVASLYIAGYAFAPVGSHKETFEMLKTATQMAVKSGNNHSMLEFVSDNHGAFTSEKSKEFLEFVYDKVRTIEKGNSQANPSETHFRLFKKELKILKSFLQSSFNPSIEGLANTDHLKTEDLPEYSDAVLMMVEQIEKWNNKILRDGSTRTARFEKKNPKCEVMDSRVVRRIMGYETEKSARYLRGLLVLTKGTGLNEREYTFEIPDYHGIGLEMISKAVKHQMDTKLKIYYDETGADLYSPEGYFILTCPPLVGASLAEAEATKEGIRSLDRQMRRKEAHMEAVEAFEEKVLTQSAAMGIQPYSVAMALGSNKERFNASIEEAFDLGERTKERKEASPEAKKRARAARDFNPDKWE